MNDLFNKSISRRDFLKLSLTVSAALVAYRPFFGPFIQEADDASTQITDLETNIERHAFTTGLKSGRIYSPLTLLAANRLTFGARQEDLDWIETNGVDAFIDEQLAFENIDDSALIPRLQGIAALNYIASSPIPINAGEVLSQLQQATLLRSVYSKRQLYELMIDFWTNHFNIYFNSNNDYILKTVDDRDVIRKYAFGSFRDLLGASAHSPAMLLSYGVNSSLAKDRKNPQNPSEYYARELLELQTLGLNGSYSDKDVADISRAFTGWTVVSQVNNRPIVGQFNFNAAIHDQGGKKILGHELPVNGDEKDGERVLDILASMPDCALYISSKLAQRFISDNPPDSVVKTGAGVFQSSHGDIRATLGSILHSPEFKNSSGLKMKRPLEFVASALRVLNAETDAGSPLLSYIQRMGQPLFLQDKPGGFPDNAEAWVNAGNMVMRWNFAKAITSNSISGTTIDAAKLDLQSENIVADLSQIILARNLPTEVMTALQPLADDKKTSVLAAVLVGSPLFQLRG